jgi:plastocyanin
VFGRAPTANGQPSIVVLIPSGGPTAPAQAAMPVMDQAVMTFFPPTLFVRTAQPVEFRNSDDVLHNVNVKDEDTKVQAFNVAIPTGATYTYTFASDGFYGVRCDIHPAMWALVVSTSSPYAMQTDESGAFAFDNVAAGSYTVRVYVGARTLERAIEVTSSSMEVSFAAN